MEHPYRPMPKDNREFDPEKHEKTVHKKGPLKGKETWVRKSAIESDKEATEEAEIRNTVAEEPGWFARLFSKSDKETGLGIAQEEALEKELVGLDIIKNEIHRDEEGMGVLGQKIFGVYNGHTLDIVKKETGYGGRVYPEAFIDGTAITQDDAEKIWKKLKPLLKQRDKNRKKLEQTNNKLETKKPVLEILGKLPPKKNSKLEGSDEPKQLGPKTEQ